VNRFKISLISAFIFVGSYSSLFVFTDALSASSSTISKDEFIFFSGGIKLRLRMVSLIFLNVTGFFLVTKIRGIFVLSIFKEVFSPEFPVKSFDLEVMAIGSGSLGSAFFPTPMKTLFIES
jgi:hypothetical protein